MTHYQVLEVAENASPEVLKAAYKSLMQRLHPDKNPGDAMASARAARLARAYEILSDPVRRAAYDAEIRQGRADLAAPQMRTPARAATYGENSVRNPKFWTSVSSIALFVFFAWLLWPTAEPTKGPAKLDAAAPPAPATGMAVGSPAAEARVTMPEFIRNMRVDLPALAPSGSPALPGPSFVLVIPTLDIVVGSFDPDRYTMFMHRNRDSIAQHLAERLAKATPATLTRPDGDLHLKRQILDALVEITGTRPQDGHSLPQNAGTRYGAVEVLLPEGFTIESRLGGQATVSR
jgi:hypothetical protein